jgi:hypothetical protein
VKAFGFGLHPHSMARARHLQVEEIPPGMSEERRGSLGAGAPAIYDFKG